MDNIKLYNVTKFRNKDVQQKRVREVRDVPFFAAHPYFTKLSAFGQLSTTPFSKIQKRLKKFGHLIFSFYIKCDDFYLVSLSACMKKDNSGLRYICKN